MCPGSKEVGHIANGSGDIVQMFTADFASGPGASGSPVFGKDGRVVGICICGLQDMVFSLSVGWIRETLKNMDQVKSRNVRTWIK